MCGHGSIGVATTLVEAGWIQASGPSTKVFLDTPAGLVTLEVKIEDGSVVSSSLLNVPSFLYAEHVKVSGPGKEKISVDVAFGGNFYVLVNVEDLNLDITPPNVPHFVNHAEWIMNEVNKAIKIVHPEQRHITGVSLVHFYGPPTQPQADSKTLIVGTNVDRSPCGTGTSARMGALYARGKLSLGATFCTESVIGTLFRGEVLEEKKVGEFLAIVPKITGSAYLTGFHQFIIQSSDPLKHGFVLE